MSDRKLLYEELKHKLENAGFIFEKHQLPHRQKRNEEEYVFIHPELIKSFELDGYKVNATKFYLKPLSDEHDCEIGFVTGKTSPLYKIKKFCTPNIKDLYQNQQAWTNKESDNSLDLLITQVKTYTHYKKVAQYNNTFLFAWNPTKWEWTDFEEDLSLLENRGYVEKRWSCGNSKNIKKGDRIFLVRLGEEPKGLIGSGYAKSSYFQDSHWNEEIDKLTNYIDIEFDVLFKPSSSRIFGTQYFEKIDPDKIQIWYPQQSGISIKNEIIDSLESNWLTFLNDNNLVTNSFVSNEPITEISENFFEGKSKEVLQTRYERNPEARKICLSLHGFSCQICDFNFENNFGEIGKGFIHVHHINPIATIKHEYKIDPKNDLIPVCPNCHAMIHSKKPAIPIDDLKIIRTQNLKNQE